MAQLNLALGINKESFMETIYTTIELVCYVVIFISVFNITLITCKEIEKEYF